MPIKVVCQCGQSFAAPDNLAGKTVKCPKCSSALTIPKAPAAPAATAGAKAPAKPAAPASPAARAPAANRPAAPKPTGGMDDLFDEIGIKAHAGQRCMKCSSPLAPGATLCIKCGFNSATGAATETTVKSGPKADAHGSVADALLSRAEKEIAATPLQKPGSDDGGTWKHIGTWVLLLCIPLIIAFSGVIVGWWGLMIYNIGGSCLLLIEKEMYEWIIPQLIFFACLATTLVAWWGCTSLGLDHHVLHGLAALLTPPFYAQVYGLAHYQKCKQFVDLFFVASCLSVATYTSVFVILAIKLGTPAGYVLLFLVLCIAVSTCLSQFAYMQLTVAAFQESNQQGYLTMMVPGYCLYYGISRWEECKRDIVIMLSGIVLVFVMGFVTTAMSAGMAFGYSVYTSQQPKVKVPFTQELAPTGGHHLMPDPAAAP